MRRDLVVTRSGAVVGSIMVDGGGRATFDRYANEVLARMRRDLGDAETARQVMADGWSNGYLYFSEPVESPGPA